MHYIAIVSIHEKDALGCALTTSRNDGQSAGLLNLPGAWQKNILVYKNQIGRAHV